MKKLLAFLTFMLVTSYALAAGSVTTTKFIPDRSKGYATVTIAWTGDASDGTVPSTVLDLRELYGYVLIKMDVTTGTTQPTALYDITISNSIGDITGGALTNLLAAGAQPNISPLSKGGQEIFIPITSNYTFALSGNSVASATGTVILYAMPVR